MTRLKQNLSSNIQAHLDKTNASIPASDIRGNRRYKYRHKNILNKNIVDHMTVGPQFVVYTGIILRLIISLCTCKDAYE